MNEHFNNTNFINNLTGAFYSGQETSREIALVNDSITTIKVVYGNARNLGMEAPAIMAKVTPPESNTYMSTVTRLMGNGSG